MSSAVAAGLRDAGLDESEAWTAADLARVLLTLPRPSTLRGPVRTADARLFDQWLARDVIRTALGVNSWEGVEYVDRDGLLAMAHWAVRLDAIEATRVAGQPAPPGQGAPSPDDDRAAGLADRLSAAAEAGGYRVDKLRAALSPPKAPSGRRRRPNPGPIGKVG